MSYVAGELVAANTTTSGEQTRPVAATLATGETVVVWTSAADSSVYMRRFDADGVPIGAEQQIAMPDFPDTELTSVAGVAALEDGGFVLVWTEVGTMAPTSLVYAMEVSAAGVPGPPVQIATGSAIAESTMVEGVDALPGGGYVVTYSVVSFPPTPQLFETIYTQRVGADGQLAGPRVQVDGAVGFSATDTAVLAGGGWVTTSVDFTGFSGDAFQSSSTQFDAAGGLVASFATDGQNQVSESGADVAAFADGSYVVVWTSEGPVQGQFFDASGNPVFGPFPLADAAGLPEITVLTDGTLLLSWQQSTQAGLALFAQAFDSFDPASFDEPFSIGGAQAGASSSMATLTWDVVPTPEGGFMVVTQRQSASGDADVFAQTFTSAAAPPPPPPPPPGDVNGKNMIVGTPDDDMLTAGNGKDRLFGDAGNDTLDGGNGVDTAVYAMDRGQYTIIKTNTGFTVTGPEGTDTLIDVERLEFADISMAIDVPGHGDRRADMLTHFSESPEKQAAVVGVPEDGMPGVPM